MKRSPIDLGDPDTFATGIPYDQLADLRERGPVVWVDEPARGTFGGGPGFWAVMRHVDIVTVSRNPQIFSSFRGSTFLRDPRNEDLPEIRRMLISLDSPEHRRKRAIINRAFTPRTIQGLKGSIEKHAAGVVDRVADKGEIDVVDHLAVEMSLSVLADIMGMPAADRYLLYGWTQRLAGDGDIEQGGDPESFVSAIREMFAYADELTEERRANPGDDVWSLLSNAEVDGEQLSKGDLNRFFQLLATAGNETVRTLISGSIVTLSDEAEQRQLLLGDLDRFLPTAVEELLRFYPPIIQFRRTAIQDTELSGQRITAGQKVVVYYPSGNRDPEVFDDPDRFDITRDPNPHLSFGTGAHFCLGANFARTEATALLAELLTRLPDIEVVGSPVRVRSNFVNGLQSVPARFTPIAAAEPGGARIEKLWRA